MKIKLVVPTAGGVHFMATVAVNALPREGETFKVNGVELKVERIVHVLQGEVAHPEVYLPLWQPGAGIRPEELKLLPGFSRMN